MLRKSVYAVAEKERPVISFIDVAEACEYTHLPLQTMYKLTMAKKIPCYKVGRKLLFVKEELQDWILSQRR